MKTAIVIPAQLDSKRFPSKPFAIIDGKFMIDMVLDNCVRVDDVSVYVATPDSEIFDHVNRFWANRGVKPVTTSPDNTTGNEAVAEAALKIPEEIVVNVQGDEPLLGSELIEYAINMFEKISKDYRILNCYTNVTEEDDFGSPNCIHTVVNKFNELLYMSRSVIPYSKDNLHDSPLKQVCIYVFKRGALIHLFRKCKKGYLENTEDICMLRALENGYKVYMLPVKTDSHAVDVPEDIAIVESKIRGYA